jgi:8-oxo-dGTP pyrophosphatase MutT (NUDIX family)
MTRSAQLRQRLVRALVDPEVDDPHPDHRDESHFSDVLENLRDAAVLIAVTDRPEPGVIFVQRPDYMRSHPGQVAFPGGKIDDTDADAIAAALREAQEEVSLDPAVVDVIGPTDQYRSGSGYNIQPVLAIIPPDLPLVACPEEVDSWFETPLDYLMDPGNITLHRAFWRGRDREYFEILWQERRIWGVTAGIIANLRHRIGSP